MREFFLLAFKFSSILRCVKVAVRSGTKYKIPTNRVHHAGTTRHGRGPWVPFQVSRVHEAPAPHLPLPARDQQALRDERIADARVTGMTDIIEALHSLFNRCSL